MYELYEYCFMVKTTDKGRSQHQDKNISHCHKFNLARMTGVGCNGKML